MSIEDDDFARAFINAFGDNSLNRTIDTNALKETKTGSWILARYCEWPIRIDQRGKTLVWDDGRPLMNNTPLDQSSPNTRVIERAAILFTGTSIDNGYLSKDLASSLHRDPVSRSYPIYQACQEHQLAKAEIEVCTHMSAFWESFFGTDKFLDEPVVSKPAVLFATGAMRNYNWDDGETVDVCQRLSEIAMEWNVPLVFLKEFDHGFGHETHGLPYYRENPLDRVRNK